MEPVRPLREVFAELSGAPGFAADPVDPAGVLARHGYPGMPEGLLAEAILSYAESAPVEVAEQLAPFVAAHSPVPARSEEGAGLVQDATPSVGDALALLAGVPVAAPDDVDPAALDALSGHPAAADLLDGLEQPDPPHGLDLAGHGHPLSHDPDPVGPDLVGPDLDAPVGPDLAGPDLVGPDLVGPDLDALDGPGHTGFGLGDLGGDPVAGEDFDPPLPPDHDATLDELPASHVPPDFGPLRHPGEAVSDLPDGDLGQD